MEATLHSGLQIIGGASDKTGKIIFAAPPSSNYSIISERLRKNIPTEIQCALFCGGRRCKYELFDYWSKSDMAIEGIFSHWVTEEILAMARPNSYIIQAKKIVEQFKRLSILSLINLQQPGEHSKCGQPLENCGFSYDPEIFMKEGIYFYNFSMRDYGEAGENRILDMVKVMSFALNEGKVAIHCHAGLGRTGVLIACYLIFHLKVSANQAMQFVRSRRPNSIQTRSQIQCCQQFERYVISLCDIFINKEGTQERKSQDLTLSNYIKKQQVILHGYETKHFKHIPKIIFILGENLLGLADAQTIQLKYHWPPFTEKYLVAESHQLNMKFISRMSERDITTNPTRVIGKVKDTSETKPKIMKENEQKNDDVNNPSACSETSKTKSKIMKDHIHGNVRNETAGTEISKRKQKTVKDHKKKNDNVNNASAGTHEALTKKTHPSVNSKDMKGKRHQSGARNQNNKKMSKKSNPAIPRWKSLPCLIESPNETKRTENEKMISNFRKCVSEPCIVMSKKGNRKNVDVENLPNGSSKVPEKFAVPNQESKSPGKGSKTSEKKVTGKTEGDPKSSTSHVVVSATEEKTPMNISHLTSQETMLEAILCDHSQLMEKDSALLNKFKARLTHQALSWDILMKEKNKVVLTGLLFEWIEHLHKPLLGKDELSYIVILGHKPIICMKKFPLELQFTLEYLFRLVYRMFPNNEEHQHKFLRRLMASLTHQAILIDHYLAPGGKNFSKLREGTLRKVIEFGVAFIELLK